ncbi:MAG: hypothetical protein H0W28_13595 [Pyrinomonadaceae bacterium]|nr:hypothetical protein [Pyrinomonadaceae bacterium]
MKNRFVSLGVAIAVLSMTVGLPLSAPNASAKQGTNSINVVPTITSLSVVNGQLVASGTATAVIKGQTVTAPFSGVPVDIALAPNQAGATCPILDLMLGPITLNLLGLVVETSPICLTITATQGGGLLGDLLCSVANLLNGGLTLNQILAGSGVGALPGLDTTQVNSLLAGLTDLLNGALANLAQAVLTAIEQVAARRTCAILHLELGPLNLTLLGLNVMLDNCANGPVTVDITGVRGRGNLLGNLLCSLLGGNLLNPGATLQDILNQILARLP